MSGTAVGALLREAAGALSAGGNDNPRFEAEQLLMKLCGVTRNDMLMYPGLPVTEEQAERVRPFFVGEGVLIPRQDTETIAELAAGFARERAYDGFLAADLCAGSGCIGITLAKLADVPVKLVELSDRALEYLKRNIRLNGAEALCEAVRGDVLDEATAEGMPQFDLIVTNPPYLTAQDMRELQTEVSHEPETALFGGEDGLDYYRRMIPLWRRKLKPGGMLAAEIGMGQEADVARIFEDCGITAHSEKDMCGVIRVIYGNIRNR